MANPRRHNCRHRLGGVLSGEYLCRVQFRWFGRAPMGTELPTHSSTTANHPDRVGLFSLHKNEVYPLRKEGSKKVMKQQ